MKNRIKIVLILALMAGFSVTMYSGNGPDNPGNKG